MMTPVTDDDRFDPRDVGRDGGSRTRNATGYEPVPGSARIAAMSVGCDLGNTITLTRGGDSDQDCDL